MSPINSSLWNDLENRGLIKQFTAPELIAHINTKPITVYVGFDPTADSLHIGHLLPLLTLRRFQEAGHKVIALAGGATGMIGDPSGKSVERSLLTPEVIHSNVGKIRAILGKILKLDGPNPALVLNNADWFQNFSFLDFLRDVGKHFTVNHMMAKDSVKSRLEDRDHGISYTEFSYMLLQAYDFYHLHKNHHCELQMGGSDQWGNITAGTDLIRRMQDQESPAYGLTLPLVLKSDGTKFGKSESGALWLDAAKTTPFQMYQYLMQTPDSDVMTHLNYFTFLTREERESLAVKIADAPEKREAQRALADALVQFIHGEEELRAAQAATQALFSNDLKTLSLDQVRTLFASSPSREISHSELASTPGLIDWLVSSGLCASRGMARKDIEGGGINLNNMRISDVNYRLSSESLLPSGACVLRKGKKSHFVLIVR